jgi:hypothetical protein
MMELLLAMREDMKTDKEERETIRKADKEERETIRKADQAKIEAGQKELLAKLDADRRTDKEDFLAKMDANQAKADADRVQMQELMKMMQAYQARTDAVLLAMQVTETSRKETAAAFKPETEVNGGTSRRKETDLTGQETGGGRRI